MRSVRSPRRLPQLAALEPGDHVCWFVGADDEFARSAAACLHEGAAAGDKLFHFAPGGDGGGIGPAGVGEADPAVLFLDGGPLDPDRMFDGFRRATAQAVGEGYRGLRVVADMDWLAATGATAETVTAFELRLDQVVADLAAIVVCAYRPGTLPAGDRSALGAVHPHVHGEPEHDPGVRVWYQGDGTWAVSGEVDLANEDVFRLALAALARPGAPLTLDLDQLDFLNVGGITALARTARSLPGLRMRLLGTRPVLARCWSLLGFDAAAPGVELVT